MKRLSYLVGFLAMISCEDSEILPKEYPFVVMLETIVDQNGVAFIGEIADVGHLSITGHGFIWSKGSTIDSINLFSQAINGAATIGEFELTVSSDLQENEKYTVRPYVETENLIVLGNSISFQSQGSLQPIIEDFFPKSGSSADTITITGSNFSAAKNRTGILLGKDSATVISADFQEIKFVLPARLSISGEVQLTLTSGEYSLISNNTFLITGHQILDFSPNVGIIGETEIIITGSGFQDSGNQVRVGGFNAIILEESETEISVQLPYTLVVGEAVIEVEIDGKVAISENSFNVQSRWSRLNDFPGEPRVAGYFGVVNEQGYLICGSQNPGCCNGDFDEIWRYDFSTDEWDNIGLFPGMARSLGVGFSLNEEIYYGLGVNNFQRLSDFWRYDPVSQEWNQLSDFPGTPRYDVIQFTLNNKGYIIGGSVGSGNSREVWEFDPITGSWKQLGSITNGSRFLDGRDVFFQSNNRAYLLPIVSLQTSSYILYEFNPSDPNFLSEITEIPFDPNRRGRLSGFMVGDDMFIGGDEYNCNGSTENPEYWKYNLSTNSWTRIESFLGGERNLVNTFSKDGYGYVFFGEDTDRCSDGSTQYLPDLWRYDPTK